MNTMTPQEKPIIEARNISKKYLINHQKAGYVTLRDTLTRLFQNPFKALRKAVHEQLTKKEAFWALDDINFSIARGEVVGIIGHNGAGKSTLLKILSQITLPTTGEITIRGRVGSLLEVGTGFHPELTGRENIFLNGAILGMTKKEITEKFDAIVAFADIAQFLDTPVKYYSSGMYVRLAFSVAAHMEPDVLIIDEVLAVGDMEFQKKCLGKMDEITKKDGRTILFVSHNMNAIEQLCKKVIVLEKGKIVFQGETKEGIKRHINARKKGTEKNDSEIILQQHAFENPWFKPLRFSITNEQGMPISSEITKEDTVLVSIEGFVEEPNPALTVGYALYDENGYTVYWSYQTDTNDDNAMLKVGTNTITSKIPTSILNQGTYSVRLLGGIHNQTWIFDPSKETPTLFLSIGGKLSDSVYWTNKRPGIVAPIIPWNKK